MNCVGCSIKINPLNAAAPFCTPECRKRHRAKRKKDDEIRNAKLKSTPLRSFYHTRAWKIVRFEALKRDGAKCVVCGAKASEDVTLHVDHIIPKSIAPKKALDLDNLQTTCRDCNLGKGAWDETNFR
jgi:5-methylcytosine-specific restriction endonuclease McrA